MAGPWARPRSNLDRFGAAIGPALIGVAFPVQGSAEPVAAGLDPVPAIAATYDSLQRSFRSKDGSPIGTDVLVRLDSVEEFLAYDWLVLT